MTHKVMHQFPSRFVVFVGLSDIQVVCLEIERYHEFFVYFYYSERRINVLEGCHRARNILYTNVLIALDTLHNVEFVVVGVTEEGKSHHVLIPLHQSSESVTPPMYTVVIDWDMSNDDGLTPDSFQA